MPNSLTACSSANGLSSKWRGDYKRKEFHALGVRTFLTKPYTPEKLLLALDDLLRGLPSAESKEPTGGTNHE